MNEQSLGFVNQLIEKTEKGKLSWSAGFEDDQYKTLLPDGNLAFVVQVKGDVRKFKMLDDHQDIIIEETVPLSETVANKINYGDDTCERLYEAIGNLQELACRRASQVNEKMAKLAKAGEMLAAI
jgi:hypothetical protein